jgi:hypothetical protein
LLGTNYANAESKVFIGTSCTYQEHIDVRVRHLSMMKEEITKTLLEKEVQSPRREETNVIIIIKTSPSASFIGALR